MDFFRRAFSEDNGNPSTMRLLAFIGPMIILLTWSSNCLLTKTFVPIDTQTLATLAVLVGGKVWQKGQELTGQVNAKP